MVTTTIIICTIANSIISTSRPLNMNNVIIILAIN